MSHIARELKMLFYLNDNKHRFVKIKEIANILEVTDRQVRRYRGDLEQNDFSIEERRGPDGGYKLLDTLDKSLMIPDNIMLALNIAAKNNESLIKSLKELPVVPKINKDIIQNDIITDNIIDNAVILANAINEIKTISFHYVSRNGKEQDFIANPYKLVYTNHTYYLLAVDNDILKSFDIDNISNIEIHDKYEQNIKFIKESDDYLTYYGIKADDKETKLILEYDNESILKRIDRLFNYKGKIDKDNKTYTVISKSENELFYPLFSLGSTKIKILNNNFKEKYIKYLEKQLNELKKH